MTTESDAAALDASGRAPRTEAPHGGDAHPSAALATARVFVDELCRAGLAGVVVAPGSRSTALALAVAERQGLATWVFHDERSMSFFALGLARAKGRAVAVVCTSGTAVANLLPAVIESSLGGGALVLLTADRPPELRDCGSPQTIAQAGLFGTHVRWSVDLPLLEPGAGARTLRALAARAAATANAGRGGPVHANVPLREPFVDASYPGAAPCDDGARGHGAPFAREIRASGFAAEDLAELAQALGSARRGVLVCAGDAVPVGPVVALARTLGWPVLADPLSGLRFGEHDRTHVVDAAEVLLRREDLGRILRPDAVVRLGLAPVSRSVQRWIEQAWPARHVLVAGSGWTDWPDPFHAASDVMRGDPAEACHALARACAPLAQPEACKTWREQWTNASRAASAVLQQRMEAGGQLFEGRVLSRVVSALSRAASSAQPDAASASIAAGRAGNTLAPSFEGPVANLVLGNSMPVRDADAFLAGSATRLRVFANRGASGIDGVLSTALGIAAGSEGPTAVVLGDLSFLHDSGALAWAARHRIPLAIVVPNNDGGAIFSWLPVRATLDAAANIGSNTGTRPPATADAAGHAAPQPGDSVFRRFFTTPHGTDLSLVAAVTGGAFLRVTDSAELAGAVEATLQRMQDGPVVLEVAIDPEAAERAHREAVQAAQEAAGQFLAGRGKTDAAPAATAAGPAASRRAGTDHPPRSNA